MVISPNFLKNYRNSFLSPYLNSIVAKVIIPKCCCVSVFSLHIIFWFGKFLVHMSYGVHDTNDKRYKLGKLLNDKLQILQKMGKLLNDKLNSYVVSYGFHTYFWLCLKDLNLNL